MKRIVKVGGVEIVLNGQSIFRSADENWYAFVPFSISKWNANKKAYFILS